MEVRRARVRFPGVCVWLGGWEKEKTLISVELVAKVEEEACRLARETAGGGEGEVGSDQKIVDNLVVDLACDCFVVSGGTRVAEDGSLVGGGPHETEDSGVERGIGCSQIVKGKVGLGVGEDFGQVEFRLRGVTDSYNRAREEFGS